MRRSVKISAALAVTAGLGAGIPLAVLGGSGTPTAVLVNPAAHTAVPTTTIAKSIRKASPPRVAHPKLTARSAVTQPVPSTTAIPAAGPVPQDVTTDTTDTTQPTTTTTAPPQPLQTTTVPPVSPTTRFPPPPAPVIYTISGSCSWTEATDSYSCQVTVTASDGSTPAGGIGIDLGNGGSAGGDLVNGSVTLSGTNENWTPGDTAVVIYTGTDSRQYGSTRIPITHS